MYRDGYRGGRDRYRDGEREREGALWREREREREGYMELGRGGEIWRAIERDR